MQAIDAIIELMHEAQNRQYSNAAVKNAAAHRIAQACKVLKIHSIDTRSVFVWFGYCDAHGNPRHKHVDRVWP